MTVRRSSKQHVHKRIGHRRKFFYAEAEAGVYDETIELVVPMHRQMQDVVVELARVFSADRQWAKPNVLDVGSGTGAQALGILNLLPTAHLVALDLCEPMHEVMRTRAGRAVRPRFTSLTGDIADRGITSNRLLRTLPQDRRPNGFQIVVSCFTLHHLPHRDKQTAIRKIYSVLAPGGVFILGDLFSFHSPLMSDEALRYDLDWIRSHFRDEARSRRGAAARAKLKSLERRWLNHYRRDNLTEPVEQALGRDSKSISGMLHKAGFVNVASPFRFWQVGVVVGEKELETE